MNIIIFTHPHFLRQQSMIRFARMLEDGIKERGHNVELWMPQSIFFKLPMPTSLKKWMGYIDQYIIFPMQIKELLKSTPDDYLFVFTDHALGPWIPIVCNRPHVIHCHDFLAQRSALGEIMENPTSWTGRLYQKYIRMGYSKAKNFISVSNKTKADLHRFLPFVPSVSEMVYNGLNQSFSPMDTDKSRITFGHRIGFNLKKGYFLHVGGNDWYKNRIGVLEIYNCWRAKSKKKLPLILIGSAPDKKMKNACNLSPYRSDIHFLIGMKDELVRIGYCGASALVYPSLEEGFGWPIAEAMASGCPVITTGEAPMTEVAGNACFFIPRRPYCTIESIKWAENASLTLDRVLNLSKSELEQIKESGLENAKRFDTQLTLEKIMNIYQQILINGVNDTYPNEFKSN